MSENTTGSGSGLKHAKAFNFGFMAGVRQLRDEEYQDQYKPSLMPPGSSNFLKVAQEQFNMEPEGEGHSGYMAEEPGNTPAWRRVPEHLKKLRLPKLLYDGTALDDPNDSYENGIAGQWSAKMRKHGKIGKAPLPGYDGAVSGALTGSTPDAEEGEEEVAEVAGSVAGARVATKRVAKALAKGGSVAPSATSDPRVGGGGSATGSGTTAQDPRASVAGWEPGSTNMANLATLKKALLSAGVQLKPKAKRGGAE